jgi:deoxyhypusine monooxygenase
LSNLIKERIETISKMEQKFEQKDVSFFVSLLRHKDRVIRIRALSALEVIGDQSVVQEIGRVLLEDEDPVVRHEAAFVLGQLGYKSALPYLERAVLEDPAPIVRHESAVAIGVIGDQSSRKTLEKVMNSDAEEIVRFSAEIALTNLEFLRETRTSSRFSKIVGG